MTRRVSAFESFGHRNYRLFWGGTLFSTTAFMTTFLLVPIVAFEITGSALAAAAVERARSVASRGLAPEFAARVLPVVRMNRQKPSRSTGAAGGD